MRKFIVLVGKDLLLEARQKDVWVLMIAFAVLELFLFAFTLGDQGSRWGAARAGILWMGFLFAGMLSIGRSYARESQEDTLTALSLAPGGRMPVFWAKLAVAFVAMVTMEGVVVPLYAMLFNLPQSLLSGPLALVLVLGALGVVAVGTLMAAVGFNLSGHDTVMPILLMPLEVPVAITAVQATAQLWQHGDPWPWIHGLMAFDMVFLALPLLAYEFLWEV